MSALDIAASAQDSASRLIGLIGSGIGQSLTPALHEREARAQGLCCLYRIIDLDELGLTAADTPGLLAAARRLGFDGLNITHPSKQVILDYLDELSPDAAALQAVNTVVFRDGRAVGHNTDWSGFAESFARGLTGVAANRVVLLGAGGAGAAVAHAALTVGTRLLTIVDLDGDRALSLAADLDGRFGAGRARAAGPAALASALASADGLIHATPTGMVAHPGLPLPPACSIPGSGSRTSCTCPWIPNWSARHARWAAGPWTAAAWRSSRRSRPSACSPGARPMPSACSGTSAPSRNRPA